MKNIFLITVLLSLIFAGCNKEEIDPICDCGGGPQLDFSLSFIDDKRNDLLNPNNLNSYTHKEIRLFKDTIQDMDVTTEWSPNNKDSIVIGQYIDSIQNPYILHLRAYSEYSSDSSTFESTVFLKLSENDFDTIQTTIEIDKDEKLVKLKYNEQVLLDTENNIYPSKFYSVITK